MELKTLDQNVFKYWNGDLPKIARQAYIRSNGPQYKNNSLYEGCKKIVNLFDRCLANLNWTEGKFCEEAGYSRETLHRIRRIASVSRRAYAMAAALDLHDNEDALEWAGRVSATEDQIERIEEWNKSRTSTIIPVDLSEIFYEPPETEFASDGYVVVGYITDPNDTLEEFLGSFDTLKEAEEHARNTVANGYEEASVFHKVSKYVSERTVKKVF